jgi:hypothetical protein
MTTVTAPLKTITLAALVPDVVRSCIVLQPSPPPDPGEEPPAPVGDDAIYTPVAPGVTYDNLPLAPTIVDTSPDQMIGCIVTVADNPQGRLNALFPSAVDGDGVIDRATNDIWVYDGSVWNNVGPTPGPTIVATVVIPPWNEIVSTDATTRTKLDITSLGYALTLLTEPDPVITQTALLARSVTAYVAAPSTDFTFTVYTPLVASGGAVLPPAQNTALAAHLPLISGGSSIAVPVTDFAFEASAVPYVGTAATVIQAQRGAFSLAMPLPAISAGVTIEPPAANLTIAAALPVIVSKPAPTVAAVSTTLSSTTFHTHTNVSAQQDDIILMFVETSGDGTSIAPGPGGGLTGSFAAVTGSPVIDATTTAGSKLHAWWIRVASTVTTANILIDDSGDHQLSRYVVIRGCTTTGNPWDVTGTDTKTVTSTTASAPAVTTTEGNTLVISAVSRANDSSSTTAFGTADNSVLSSFTNRGESGTASGNGGGFVITSGVKLAPGSTGTTTFASTADSTNAAITIAFKP